MSNNLLMKPDRLSLFFGLLLLSAATMAQSESSLRDAGTIPISLAGNADPEETRVYIVQFRQPSTAEHHAALSR
ncbi:MAG: hypothetical protein KJP16_07795, partial [Gammaproteobacteria bacterium]|nr:hypothetical protein [Gammaproteobacteria bacterium]NNL50706.1 hypothetical protein [Woeseiaceae bacterium]